MKAYLIITGVIFASITVAHGLRVVYEGPAVASDPWFVVLTGVAGALCVWAGVLLARLQRSSSS